jgi:hypothetical protein
MSEIQQTSSLLASSNLSNDHNQNSNQVDTLGSEHVNALNLTDNLSTEQRLQNLTTPIDQYRSSNTQSSQNKTPEPLEYGGVAIEGTADENNNNSTGVSLCCAPVDVSWVPDIVASILPKHCWLKTDTYESGMGADCPVPGQQCSDKPGADTETIDHSGQSASRKDTECIPLKNIDAQCVDEKIRPGQKTGTWHPFNQCQSFTAGVMGECRYGPNIGPDLPSPFQK